MTEKTRFTISIISAITVIIFVITATASVWGWKIDTDATLKTQQELYEVLKIEQEEIITDVKKQEILFTEIKTDLKWIRTALEKLERGN